ncbi:MAG: hypothetical protein BWY59_00636 [Verrucomicrobia bacterium ADurb.Bin345]|nr:MAG: hypothetical protein BWY59_00636 [Verrucomicrobia bacterium ADurb.Bin345]
MLDVMFPQISLHRRVPGRLEKHRIPNTRRDRPVKPLAAFVRSLEEIDHAVHSRVIGNIPVLVLFCPVLAKNPAKHADLFVIRRSRDGFKDTAQHRFGNMPVLVAGI